MTWMAPDMLVWTLAAPVLLLLAWWSRRRTMRALARFAHRQLVRDLTPDWRRSRWALRAWLISLAAALLVIALARPAWSRTEEPVRRSGRDLIFVLDVSRSMLAEDVRPNRLERARLAIGDLVSSLRGDRVGLVVFAGAASVRCPLTSDYGFFRMVLDEVDPDAVSRGGSLIGDAIRTAVDMGREDDAGRFRDLVLITDGEDHDSFPVQAAEDAGRAGVRVIAVGLGDDVEGSLIPVRDERGRETVVMYEGEPVRSRLDGDLLGQIALASRDGRYLHVATGDIELDRVYADLTRRDEARDLEETMRVRYDEEYQLFLAAALVMLVIEMCLSDRKRRTV
jgi:Ca-activated chloride channel family protein